MKHQSDSQTYKEFIGNYYYILAISAGILFGFYNFGLSSLSSLPINYFEYAMLFNPVFVGFLLYGGIYQTREALKLKRRYGVYWDRSFSLYFQQNKYQKLERKDVLEGKEGIEQAQDLPMESELNEEQSVEYILNWYSIWAIAVRFTLYFTSQFTYYAVAYTAYRANVNYSLILNLFQVNPFLTAFLFYFAFDEKLKGTHFIGMTLLAICVVINVFAQNFDSMGESGEGELSILVPIAWAFVTCILFVLTNWTNRYYPPKTGMKSQQYISDTFIVSGISFLILTFAFPQEYENGELITIVTISLFMVSALSLTAESIAYGKAGPAQALVELESFWLLLLEITIQKQYPNVLQCIAFAVGMGGGALIAFDH